MKDRRSAGWWPSSVPNPAAAARRVSWWSRSEPPPQPQRPASLVIVHCGPSSPAPSSPSPASTPSVQRPSCSPPPPPPPRSPAASSYATADEEDESPSSFAMPHSPDGELLQGILAIMEQKGVIPRQTDDAEEITEQDQHIITDEKEVVTESCENNGEQKVECDAVIEKNENIEKNECANKSESAIEFNNDTQILSDCLEHNVPCASVPCASMVPVPPPLPTSPPPIFRELSTISTGPPSVPPPPPPIHELNAASCASSAPNTSNQTAAPSDSRTSNSEYDRLPQDFIFQIPRLSTNSANDSSISNEIRSNLDLKNLETTTDQISNSVPNDSLKKENQTSEEIIKSNNIEETLKSSEIITDDNPKSLEIIKIDSYSCDVTKKNETEKTCVNIIETNTVTAESDINLKLDEPVIYETHVSDAHQVQLNENEGNNKIVHEIKKEVDAAVNEEKISSNEHLKRGSCELRVRFELKEDVNEVTDDIKETVDDKLDGAAGCSGISTSKLEADDDSSGARPCDTSSSSDADHDGDDLTLDDATDITLDDDSSESPVPPLPKDEANKQTNAEDEYFELARSGHYENVEYKRRPGALMISKRRLQALHTPKLGAVKSGLSRAWVAMKDWGSENARKIGDLVRETSVPQDDRESTSPPPIPPHVRAAECPQQNADQELISPETSPPPLRPRARVLSPERSPQVSRRRSMLAQAAARSAQAARRSRYLPHEGQSGFDELRRYMKQGGDFCKELSTILQERAEAEAQYAKSLSKLSAKLSRSAKEAVGSVSAAWQQAAIEMEAEGEAHRDASAALAERVVRPLRATIETQHRMRKSVETAVDKTGKGLAEWRVAEAKAKKHSFACARENERLQDALQEAQRLGSRAGRTGALSEKELSKLEGKRRKAEESVKKADVEYYTFCIRAERARLEWETAVSRGSQCFQALEEQRLQHLKELGDSYLQLLSQLGPRIVQCAERLTEPIQSCDVSRDLQTVASVKGVGQPIPEQLLPDFYPEHVTLAMNRERRRLALAKLLQLIRQDLERERRAKQGVENLARALQQTPTFGTEDSQQNVSDKLHHMRSMLTYLEAARYKVHSTLEELDGHSRGSHPLASHIQITRDRQGLQQSVLKVPPWVREESLDQIGGEAADWPDRGAADGNSVQPDSDFDEFSSQASDEKDFAAVIPVLGECDTPEVVNAPNLGQCRALYDYTANLCDELNLRTGDIISVREKQEDGWWLGELNGVVGIFPATYVEEVGKT